MGPFWLLDNQTDILLLDGSSDPIHETNDEDDMELTEATALDYLRFFCYFVHGREGRFLIVENLDDSPLDQDKLRGKDFDPDLFSIVQAAIRPATLDAITDDGDFKTSAVVLYGNTLFSARFLMTEEGMVEMIDDELLAAELPLM